MNDKADDTLERALEQLDRDRIAAEEGDMADDLEPVEEIIARLENPGEQDRIEEYEEESSAFDFLQQYKDEDADDINDEILLGALAQGGFADIEGELVDIGEFDAEQVLPVDTKATMGTNWSAILWLVVFLVADGGIAFNQYQAGIEADNRSVLSEAALALDTGVREVGYQTLLAASGRQEAFGKLQSLQTDVTSRIDVLKGDDQSVAVESLGGELKNLLLRIEEDWEKIQSDLAGVLGNQDSIKMTVSEVMAVNQLAPQLLMKSEEVVDSLIQDGANLDLINIASQQRFLTQRIKANMNEFATGVPGWEQAANQFGLDVKQFGEINASIGLQGGGTVQDITEDVEKLYEELVLNADGVMNSIGDYLFMRESAGRIEKAVDRLTPLTGDLGNSLREESGEMIDSWPWLSLVLVAIALLALFAIILSILRQSRRYAKVGEQRSQVSENAIIKLLDEMGDLAQGDLTVEAEVTDEVTGAIADSINFAVAEMRGLVNGIKTAAVEMNNSTEGTEALIAQLLSSSDTQSQQIAESADQVNNMTEVINKMSVSAGESSQQAKASAEVAKQGGDAVRNTIRGMNTARNQIQETAKQLKRLGESSQQINEITDLIQGVTEQTNVLSLNASIQAAMAGEAGRGFAVVAEEVQRLAERSARASNEISELVKNIQQDVNNAIASMEMTTEEVVSGAMMADEAGRALTEIENVSQGLLSTIEEVVRNAQNESQVARRVSDRMLNLQEATAESDLSVSQVAVSIEQMRSVADRLGQSISGFKLPEQTTA